MKTKSAMALEFPTVRNNRPTVTDSNDVTTEIIIANRRGEEVRMP